MPKLRPEKGPEDPTTLTFAWAPSLPANIHWVYTPRRPFCSKEAAAGNSRAGSKPTPPFLRSPKLPAYLFTWDAPGTAWRADSGRSPRVSEARCVATTSANRRSLGTSRPLGPPARGGAPAHKQPGGALWGRKPAARRAPGPQGTEAEREPHRGMRRSLGMRKLPR